MIARWVLALAVLGHAAGSAAEPCPAHLFVIARSKNSNIVVYDANLGPDARFVPSEPVVAYWLLNGESDKREELNMVERRRAYGFDTRSGDAPGTFRMEFKAGRKRRFTVRTLKGCPAVTASIDGREGILRRLFVRSKEGGFSPSIEFVEFFGENTVDGAPLYEKFVPGN